MRERLIELAPVVVVLLLIIFIAGFLRLYRISEYMTFLGDEGRDALVINRILVDHDFPLLGPPMSVGNIYLGPLYYYMMSLAMALLWLEPAAAAGMVALIGVGTVVLIFYLARVWFGIFPAILASFAYAISPITIIYSRSSWNPNPMPFFALLSILGLFLAHRSRNFLWLILTGAALAFAVQMHYLGLILLPIVFLIWIFELLNILKTKNPAMHLVLGTIVGSVVFLILMSPLLIFDLKYNYMNYRAITTFLFGSGSSVTFDPISNFTQVLPLFMENLITRYMAGGDLFFGIILSLILLGGTLSVWGVSKKVKPSWPFIVLPVWIILGILGLTFFISFDIYDHYFGFLNPAPYLLLAGIVGYIPKKIQIILTIILITTFGYFNLNQNPLKNPPNRQLQRTQEVARFIINESKDEPYNFGLIAERNYDAAYQFYLTKYGYKPKVLPFEETNQMFVVCEDEICQPISHTKYEIAAFSPAKIEKEYTVWGVRIFKLVQKTPAEQ